MGGFDHDDFNTNVHKFCYKLKFAEKDDKKDRKNGNNKGKNTTLAAFNYDSLAKGTTLEPSRTARDFILA